ncbi:MAG: hypothetical protein ACYCW6_18565, partial [Candidatus Xenobia bacterium]
MSSFRAPDQTYEEIYRNVMAPVGRSSFRSNAFLTICGLIVLWGAIMFWRQICYGLGVTGLRMPNYWGFYIVTFVFW